MIQKMTTIVFVGLLFLGALLTLVLPKDVFSDDENRYLAQLPDLTLGSVKNGEFMEGIEAFMVDQFPARLSWIELKTKTELALGKMQSNGVFITDSGYYIESFTALDKEQLDKNVMALNHLAENIRQQFGIGLQVMLVPTASTILSELLPSYHYELNQNELIAVLADERFDLVQVGDVLSARVDEGIYYRTDHHWTSLGAYYAYQAWKTETRTLIQYTHEQLSDEFLGTLYSKVKMKPQQADVIDAYYLPRAQEVEYNRDGQIRDNFYERAFLAEKDKYSTYFNGNQSVAKIKGYGNDGKLLIVKDSYANTFAQFAVADFAEVHLVDLRYFKMQLSQYIEEEGINEVLILYNFKNFTEDRQLSIIR